MAEVIFASVSDFDKKPTLFIKKAEKSKNQIVITKRGKPVGLMRKVTANDKGRTESMSNIINHTHKLLSFVEKGLGQIIIARNNQPIIVLKRITSKAFSIKE
jgi:PHD/YefM family antitoxin component YafN of YafNO toxin-antitoxin module